MRAIVIGSGVGGLAGAIRLQLKGYHVSVFESNDQPGGKLAQLQRGGFRFDMGPSLFTMPELVDELFTLAGKEPQSHFQYDRLKTVTRYFFADGRQFSAPDEPEAFIREASRQLEEPEANLRRYLDKCRRLYETTHHVFLRRSLHRASTFFRKETLRSVLRLHELDAFSSMAQANARAFKSPHTRQLFNRYATYNGSNPYIAPATLNVISHLEHAMGAFYPRGGIYAISEALSNLAHELGVEFHFRTPVEKIQLQGNKVNGVIAQERHYQAPLVLSNADITPTYQKLLGGQPLPYGQRVQTPSTSALIFYWGVEGTYPQLDLHNILFSADYEKEFRELFTQQRLPEDPTVYINITSKRTPDDAPKECENWYVMINAPADSGQDWENDIAACRQRILEKIKAWTGIAIEEKIRVEEVWSPPGIAAGTSSHRGALYGSSSNNRFAAFLRHPNFSRRFPGLYFAGGSVHPGGGIPLCMLSAQIATDGLARV